MGGRARKNDKGREYFLDDKKSLGQLRVRRKTGRISVLAVRGLSFMSRRDYVTWHNTD